MLSVKNLTRRYGRFCAVDNVSFEIPTGEIVGLLGHNGAGKTTIMKIISGFMEANNGSVTVNNLFVQDNLKAVQRHIGYLPESLPVYPEMAVADYLDYAADLKGLRGSSKTSEIKRVVAATDLSSKFLAPIGTLSRGFKQRVGVAQAVLGNPRLLILDEPTNGLDPEQTAQMRQLIRDVAKDATVILSTHIMQEVEALCSRVLILRSGKLVINKTLAELQQSSTIDVLTSLKANKTALFQAIPGVTSVECLTAPEGQPQHFRITVASAEQLNDICAAVAAKVSTEKASLYRLTPAVMDMEKLFHEATQEEEVSHAA